MKFWLIGLLSTVPLLNATSALAASAEQTYTGTCKLCHDQGIGGAPKLGDKAAWAPRIKQGKDALYKVGLQGKPGTAMLAKGGNTKLTDAEVRAAVDYMINKSK